MNRTVYRKVTPELDKQLKDLADTLPEIQCTNAAGKPLFKTHYRTGSWDDLLPEDKIRFFKHRDKVFSIPDRQEPIIENHYMKLYWIYREKGEGGVKEYIDRVNRITEASILAAESIRPKDELPDGKI